MGSGGGMGGGSIGGGPGSYEGDQMFGSGDGKWYSDAGMTQPVHGMTRPNLLGGGRMPGQPQQPSLGGYTKPAGPDTASNYWQGGWKTGTGSVGGNMANYPGTYGNDTIQTEQSSNAGWRGGGFGGGQGDNPLMSLISQLLGAFGGFGGGRRM